MSEDKARKLIGTPEVLIVCGSILSINGSFVFGVILACLGILGSIVGYGMDIQKATQEKEEREKLYEGIKSTLISVPFLGSKEDNTVH